MSGRAPLTISIATCRARTVMWRNIMMTCFVTGKWIPRIFILFLQLDIDSRYITSTKWTHGYRILDRARLLVFGHSYHLRHIHGVSFYFCHWQLCRAIENITSQTKQIELWDAEGQKKFLIETPIWNETVANLTLMALGSSAPEILLSVI